MRETFNMPDAGEGLTEAEILTWHVAVGDEVTINQIIVEIETAKAAVELPCPYVGTVAELLAQPGDTVAVGAPIIVIDTGVAGSGGDGGEGGGTKIGEVAADGRIATLVGYVAAPGVATRRRRRPSSPGHDRRDGSISSAGRGRSSIPGEHGDTARLATAVPPAESEIERSAGHSRGLVPLAKPPVRKLAKELGVDLRELTGSGPHADITRDDVRAGVAPLSSNEAAVPVAEPAPAPTPEEGVTPDRAVASAATGGVRREPIRSLRRATAAAMVSSAFTAPHVTEFLTADVTPMIELRDRLRARRDWAQVKLSPLAFAAKAVCLAARRTPEVNAHWDEAAQEIVFYDRVQLGIAAATPRGLMVPKIREADLLSLRELATALTELTEKARAGTTTPKELVGGTITITNVGVFGVDTGTPILNPGESAILALGAVKQAPWVVDGALAVRTVCHLALAFDHRVVDGEQGSRFLADVGALLADPGLALTY